MTRNIDYYTAEPVGADFILHMRSEIEGHQSAHEQGWLIRDQYLLILTFYLKYALSGTAIPRNIMINAESMIAQASLKDTGNLLTGYHQAASLISPMASNITFQRQIEQIHRIIARHKMDHLSNLSIYPFSHLVNFLNNLTSSRHTVETPLFEPFFDRLNSFDQQVSLSLRDVHNLSLLFNNSSRLYPSVLDAMCSTLIDTPSTSLKLISTFFRALFRVNYKPERINDLCSLSQHLYENQDELRPFDMLWLALTSAGIFNQIDRKLISDIFSFDFLNNIDQITTRKNTIQIGQPLFRLNQIISIDYPDLNIPWFNDQYALDFALPGLSTFHQAILLGQSFYFILIVLGRLTDMRRHWTMRHNTFEQIESSLTNILGGKEFIQRHSLSPYFHEIGKSKNKHYSSYFCCSFRFRMYSPFG